MSRLRSAVAYALVTGLVTGMVIAGAIAVGAWRHDDLRIHLLGGTHAVEAEITESVEPRGRCGRRDPRIRTAYRAEWTDAGGRGRTATVTACATHWQGQALTIWVPDDAYSPDASVEDDPVTARTQSPWSTLRWAVWLPLVVALIGGVARWVGARGGPSAGGATSG